MQHNPDVSIREGGVMEKCSFCIQRVKRAKQDARKTATRWPMARCSRLRAIVPGGTMVFGDLNDPESRVSKLAASGRATRMLEELGTKPKVFYLGRST